MVVTGHHDRGIECVVFGIFENLLPAVERGHGVETVTALVWLLSSMTGAHPNSLTNLQSSLQSDGVKGLVLGLTDQQGTSSDRRPPRHCSYIVL